MTPEAASLLNHPSLREDGTEFGTNIPKVQSLDFKSKYSATDVAPIAPLMETQKQQTKKTMEAKAYRQKLLQQKRDEEKGSIQMSPRFTKEKSIRQRKAAVAKALEGKATFTQCVFNMANILMVSD